MLIAFRMRTDQITISNVNACQVKTECSTVGEALHKKLINNVVVIQCPSISQPNAHDAYVDNRASFSPSKLLLYNFGIFRYY